MDIHGRCDQRFRPLSDQLRVNFERHRELGAGVAVTIDGEPVVDIWAGWADAAQTRPWQPDTLVDVFSVGKPMAVLCLLQLMEQGLIELDAPVARYWPEFAAAGKERVSVRMLLGHRAGSRRSGESCPRRDVRLGADVRGTRGTGAVVGAGHCPRLPHEHVRLPRRRARSGVRGASESGRGSARRRRATRSQLQFGLDASEDARVAEFLMPDRPPDSLTDRGVS